MWAVVNTPRHWVYSVDFTRQDSIKRFLEGSELSWHEHKNNGWRCVKMTICYEGGRRGRTLSPESKAKIAAAARKQWAAQHAKTGQLGQLAG